MSLLSDFSFYAFLIAAVSLYRQWRPSGSPALNYLVTSMQSLVSVRDEVANKIEVRYSGQRVAALHLVEIAFVNTGDKAIRSTDFETPLTLVLPTSSKIFDVTRDDTPSDSVGAKYSYSTGRIRVEPLLLNAGEAIYLKVLASEIKRPWRLHARIAGTPRSKEILNHPRYYKAIRGGLTRVLSVFALLLAVNAVLHATGKELAFLDVLAPFAFVGVLLFSVALHSLSSESRMLRARHREQDGGLATNLLQPVGTSAGDEMATPPNTVLFIHSAIYGAANSYVDVTAILRAQVAQGRLDVEVGNELFGSDPLPNVSKELRLDVTVGAEMMTRVVPEGSRVMLP